MQSRSTLARLQQALTMTLAACALAWLAWHLRTAPLIGLAGFVLIGLGYSLFLAVEFVALRFAGQVAPTLQPSWRDLMGAWFAETIAAPRVFCWRQPFFWRAMPDSVGPLIPPGRRGVVFVHGFFCNRGFWTPWLARAHSQGRCYVAVNLEPVFGSIDAYSPLVEQAVREVTRVTGLPPVLVCHSMGGLAARAWLRDAKNVGDVHHVVTIGTPHRGTWLARFSRMANGRQMQARGSWLESLEKHEAERAAAPFTCWYSNCDNIVFPVLTATLPGADNRLVRGAAHVELAFRDDVMDHTFSLIVP